jgi:GWxTD domain-containing protein
MNIKGFGLILLFCLCFGLKAQINAYYTSGIFNTPEKKPFLETYLTLVGKSLTAKEVNGNFQNSVNILIIIKQDSNIIKINRYNLSGPLFKDLKLPPTFIDNQRYSLTNGSYTVRMEIRDNNDSLKEALIVSDQIKIAFNDKEIQSSVIQTLEGYNKVDKYGPLTKSGYDLIPYTVNYYPESTKELAFYYELYNTDLVLGENKRMVFSYYIETASAHPIKLNDFGSFKKVSTARVNPLLAKLDISKLGSGNYNLVVELKDENNNVIQLKKYYFERRNRKIDIVEAQKYKEQQSIAEYFGRCNNADTLKMYVECLWPIADRIDKERIINHAIKKDPEVMKHFVINFWQRRAADTANALKMWANYYQNVQQVMLLFKCGKQKGYYSERGRVYLQYGAPNQRSQQPNEHNTYPYEIWHYYRVTDATNGQFYTNRRFVFVNKMLGDDCHTLVHSDVPGELYNPRWQFELTRRNSNGISDPDNNTPAGTNFNQFDDMFNSPR